MTVLANRPSLPDLPNELRELSGELRAFVTRYAMKSVDEALQRSQESPQMSSQNFTAINGEHRNPFYEGRFDDETRSMADIRLHWATAARDLERASVTKDHHDQTK